MPTQLNHASTPSLPSIFLETQPLKWQADLIIYTDGSVQDTGHPEYYRCGAGVHRPASSLADRLDICIDPIDDMYGVANTIQRSEMVAVQHALQINHPLGTRIIATDSLCVMYMLSKHMRCPSLHKESKHLGILDSAVSNIIQSLRRGQRIQIVKVKSHIVIKGNEQADELAHDACESVNCHEQVLKGLPVRENIHWPIESQPQTVASPTASDNEASSAAQDLPPIPRGFVEPSQDDEGCPDRQVNDLRKGMKALIKLRLAAGHANQTIYV